MRADKRIYAFAPGLPRGRLLTWRDAGGEGGVGGEAYGALVCHNPSRKLLHTSRIQQEHSQGPCSLPEAILQAQLPRLSSLVNMADTHFPFSQLPGFEGVIVLTWGDAGGEGGGGGEAHGALVCPVASRDEHLMSSRYVFHRKCL